MHRVLGPDYGMYMIGYKDPTRASEVWSWNKNDAEDWIGAYLNPYTGEVLEHFDYHDTFWSYVIHLHTSLLLPHEIGRVVVGVSTLVFVFLLISGLILWFPANPKVLATAKGRRSRFLVSWGMNPKRLNYDLHNVLGFYMSWIVVFVAITGLVWSFPWVQQGIYWIASGGETVPEHEDVHSTPPFDVTASAQVDAVYQQLRAEYADAHGILIYEPADAEASLDAYVYPDEGTFYRYIGLHYDQYTGALIEADRFEDGNTGDRLLRMNYDLHVGALFGLPGRLLVFFASLIATSLPVTGVIIWYPRWRRKRRRPEFAPVPAEIRPRKPAAVSALAE
jgi:uncharacterized iron-regulated membrane protein